MRIFYYTFGCKVNQYETENVRELFNNKGYEETDDFTDAQICFINTCTVTSQSDSKCRQLIRKIRKSNPDCVIALAGCFPQAFSSQASSMTECDIIVGTGNKTDVPDLCEEFILNGERIIKIDEHKKNENFEKMTNISTNDKTRAYIKIQDGCDQYCTYCIIPFARGHIRSKPLADIKEETDKLVNSGHKEIILTGINLCCYGRDFKDGTRLIDAIETACSNDGEYRVRLGSIEPEMLSDEDIKRMSELKKLCPHFHLSLQSGCDKTLKEMNRHYNSKDFLELCHKLKKYFPDCGITTDIMVGFPNESDEDFEKSLNFAQMVSFSDAHIFAYSRRPGTKADKFPFQIEKKVKHKRALIMAEACKKGKKNFMKNMIGKTVQVLFEKENSDEWHQGHSENYIVVKVKRTDKNVTLRRQLLNVKITDSDDDFCYGILV